MLLSSTGTFIYVCIFFVIGIVIAGTVYVYAGNRKAKPVISRFLADAGTYSPVLLQHISLDYWIKSGDQSYTVPYSYADVYLFGGYIVLLRRQHFAARRYFAPVAIMPGAAQAGTLFPLPAALQAL